jgi:DNA-binding XRE family transcriptional regulator
MPPKKNLSPPLAGSRPLKILRRWRENCHRCGSPPAPRFRRAAAAFPNFRGPSPRRSGFGHAGGGTFPEKCVRTNSRILHQNLTFGKLTDFLKKYRSKLGISQDKLSKLADVTYNTIIKIESGVNTNPTIKTLSKIAKALSVSVDDLIK